MKIARLELFKVPPGWLFLKIATDDGLAGWGEPVVEGRADTVAAAVTELAEAYDTAVALHCPLGPITLAASLQLDGCIPNAFIQEQSLGHPLQCRGRVVGLPGRSVNLQIHQRIR
jgi:L-alanine-DL-glutamate epimerase-like enolase superfamily enzyme